MVHAYNPGIQRAEAGGSYIQDQPVLHKYIEKQSQNDIIKGIKTNRINTSFLKNMRMEINISLKDKTLFSLIK